MRTLEDTDGLLLAGDTGGTKTILALVSPERGLREIIAEDRFDNRNFTGLEEIVAEFLSRYQVVAKWAAFSVAGPVINGAAVLPNLKWRLDQETIRSTFGLSSVRLLNDLQATAYAIPSLAPEDILTLQAGTTVSGGPVGVIAPGTGLGEAFMLPSGGGYHAYPSEGGNADFAPIDSLQAGLLQYLLDRDGRVSYEDVCSGRGIPNIYAFLKDSGAATEPDWLAARLATVEEKTPVIVMTALEDESPDSICALTLKVFCSILASEAGNLGLGVLATGGVYLGGGIPPRILPFLKGPWVLEAFRKKGWISDLLSTIPLHVILEPRAALLGAARYGLDLVAAVSAAESAV